MFVCTTGKPCKYTEISWQNTLTCTASPAIPGDNLSRICPQPIHLNLGGHGPSGPRRVQVCEWKQESLGCGVQFGTIDRRGSFIVPHNFLMQNSWASFPAKSFSLGNLLRAPEASYLSETKTASSDLGQPVCPHLC